jgi:ABC-type molybdate transport system substrate-binding protein
MVPKGNPKGIRSIFDLARDDVVISHPNPENEDIGKYIVQMYLEVGGEELMRKIMVEKAKKGTTKFTTIHHRETPERILKGEADIGLVWATEVIYAQMKGLPVEMVEVERDMRDRVNYYIAKLKDAPNPENAEAFLEFIRSDEAKRIYEKYGFVTER